MTVAIIIIFAVLQLSNRAHLVEIIKAVIRTALISLQKGGRGSNSFDYLARTRRIWKFLRKACFLGDAPFVASGSTALASSRAGGGVFRLHLSPTSPATRSSFVSRLPHHASQVSFCSAFLGPFFLLWHFCHARGGARDIACA